jgi:outer membrane protein assembly factor BamB
MRAAALACAVLFLAGCSTLDRINPFSGSPKAKMTALSPIQASAEVQTLWRGQVGKSGDYTFVPAVAGDSVFAAGSDGTVARFDGGREDWRIQAAKTLSGGVGADDKLVVVGTVKGEVLAFDVAGKPLWQSRVSSEVLAPPVIAPGMVIVRSGDSRIHALDIADGKRRWVYQRSTPALSLRSAAGVVVYRNVVLAGFPGGKLVAIDTGNGAAVWEATVALPRGATELERVADIVSVPVVSGSTVCAVAYQGRVGCFDVASGSQMWTRDLSSSVGLDADDRNVYVTDDKGAVHALELASGASVWKQDKLLNRGVSRPVASGGFVIVGDGAGVVHALKREDGAFAARLTTDGSAVDAEPRRLANGAVVQTGAGGVYALGVK